MARSIITQVAAGISLIILAAGTLNYIHSRYFHGGGVITLVLVVGVIAFVYIRSTPSKPESTNSDNEAILQRMTNLENRLTDIQDVVISIDDRMSRQKSMSENQDL